MCMIKNRKKRFLALVLTACAAFSSLPSSYAAEDIPQETESVAVAAETKPVQGAYPDAGNGLERGTETESPETETASETETAAEASCGDETGILETGTPEKSRSNVLTFENEDDAGKYSKVVLENTDGFPDGSRLKAEPAEGKDLDTLTSSLKETLQSKEIDTVLPLNISLLDSRQETMDLSGKTVVYVYMHDDQISIIKGTRLYHADAEAAGAWRELEYSVHEGTDDELPYVAFETDHLGNFIFANVISAESETKITEVDTETTGAETETTGAGSDGSGTEQAETEASETEDAETQAGSVNATKNPMKAGSQAKSKAVTVEAQAGDGEVIPLIIDSYTAGFSSGASLKDGKYVWSPTDPASGHMFVYRVNYEISGTFSNGEGALRIELPLHILKDRDGAWADSFECPYVHEDEIGDGEKPDFAWREENGKAVIYNCRDIPAGEAGYIEFAYATTKQTLAYVDMAGSSEVASVLHASNEAGTVSETAVAEPVYIDTHAEISFTQKEIPDFYEEWQGSWGAKPVDAGDWLYLVWIIRSNIGKNTSPYNFSLKDTFTDLGGSVVGYRFAGQSSYSTADKVENQKNYGDRYDYVLTRHSREEAEALLASSAARRYKVYNRIRAVVDPVDQVDEDTDAEASRTWWYEAPKYIAPTGHFWAEKYGLYSGGCTEHHSHDLYTVGRKNYKNVCSSEEISDYTLEEFQEGETDSIGCLRYYTYGDGYPYPWTLSDDADGTVQDALQGRYGNKKVDYELTDDAFYLEDADTPLADEDYDITGIQWSTVMNTAAFYEEKLAFAEAGAPDGGYVSEDAVTVWARDAGGWKKAAVYDMAGGSYRDVDSSLIREALGDKIEFAEGVKGFRFTCRNAYYHTRINVYPEVSLKRTGNVLSLIGKGTGKTKVKLANQAVFSVTQGGKTLFSRTAKGTAYIQRVIRESEIRKNVVQTRNDKKSKQFIVTWRVSAAEKYKDNNGIRYIPQASGTFYDLAPAGAVVDTASIKVSVSGDELPQSSYKASSIENFRDTGRTLVKVDITAPTNIFYVFSYSTRHPYDAIHDYGSRLLNSAAYETGNDRIAEGFPDDGGHITDKELLAGLDDAGGAERFLYAEAGYEINILMAANTGLMKRVKNADDNDYSYDTTVSSNDVYTYQIRLANDAVTDAKGIVLFDSLENFYQQADETQPTIGSDWHGTLTGIDISSLKAKGAQPVVYLSGMEDMNIHHHHDLAEEADGKPVWMEYHAFTAAYGLEKARAVAIDASRKDDGSDFILGKEESIAAVLYMRSPESDATNAEDPVAYNNIYVERTALKHSGDDVTEIPQFYHQDYTRVHYRISGSPKLLKVDASDGETPVEGASYLLRGSSDYGTEYSVTAASGSDGGLIFGKVEKGSYELLETSCSDDWQLDTELYHVTVDGSGNVSVVGMEKDGEYFIAKDEPRIHTDIRFKKYDSITKNPLNGAGFLLSGTSDYGNEVMEHAVSEGVPGGSVCFENIELGTYQMAETEAPEGYIRNGSVWTVRVDERGVAVIYDGGNEAEKTLEGYYALYNEPLHEIRFVKSSTYGDNIYLGGAEFSLSGVLDYGTDVDMAAVSASGEDGGLVTFAGLEPGTYLLKETKAPEGHDLNGASYTVTVKADGSFSIDGLGKAKFGNTEVYDFKDPRTAGTVCVTKVWEDGRTNEGRSIPDITISAKKPSRSPLGYTITFVTEDSTFANGKKENHVTYNASGRIVDGVYMLPLQTDNKYFDKWYKDPEQTVEYGVSGEGIPTETLTGDMTVYAGMAGGVCAVWYDNGDLVFQVGETPDDAHAGCQVYGVYTGFEEDVYTSEYQVPWYGGYFTSVQFKAKISPVSTAYWFAGCSDMVKISGLHNLDTSNVTDMSYMFYGCGHIGDSGNYDDAAEFDVSTWDVSKVTDMSHMFDGVCCMGGPGLNAKGIGNWDTSSVTDMSYMFANTNLAMDLSGFGCHGNLSYMFYRSEFNSLSLYNAGYGVTDASHMFDSSSCSGSIDIGDWGYGTSGLTDVSYMFNGCYWLEEIPWMWWIMDSVTDMSYMFAGTGLSTADLTVINDDWSSCHAEKMTGMFEGCSSLQKIVPGKSWQWIGTDAGLPGTSWKSIDTGQVFTPEELYTSYDGNTMSTGFTRIN